MSPKNKKNNNPNPEPTHAADGEKVKLRPPDSASLPEDHDAERNPASKAHERMRQSDEKNRLPSDARVNALEKVYERDVAFEKPVRRPSLIPLILVSVVVGCMSGLVTALLALTGSLPRLPFFNRFEIQNLIPSSAITIARTEKVTVTANERIDEVVAQAQEIVYGIYQAKQLTLTIEGLVAAARPPYATAVAVTSDGWLVTSAAVSDKLTDYAVINRNGDTFPITEKKEDQGTQLTYVRIRANGLPVANFLRDRGVVVAGTQAVATTFQVGARGRVFPLTVTGTNRPIIRDSDNLDVRILLSETMPAAAAGAPVMLLTGEVGGIVTPLEKDEIAEALPAVVAALFVSQLSGSGPVTRPQLGVHYLELSSTAHLVFDAVQERRAGALLVDQGTVSAVAKGSNAAAAGLQKGDIITKVDQELVNDIIDLATVIQSYKPDAKVILTYYRGGEEKIVEVSLAPSAPAEKD